MLINLLRYFKYYFPFKLNLYRLKASKARKNILCIIPHMGPGGVEKVILTIAKEVDSQKFSFHLMTTLSSANEWRSKFEPHFQNIITPAQKSIDSLCCRYVSDLVKKLNIDIILLSHSTDAYECLSKLSEKLRVNVVDLLHNNVYPPIQTVIKSTSFIDRRICISDKLKNYILESYRKYGISSKYAERILVISNGVDTEMYRAKSQTKGCFKSRYSIPEDSKLVSFIGRLSEEKNPLLFAEIGARILAHTATKVHFVMAGDGPELGRVRATIKNKSLDAHFTLTGTIDDVVELLNDTDILLLFSKIEGVPVVILEAMSMGIPVVSTDVGAISEVIENNVNGFLIDPAKSNENLVKAFEDKILDLVEGRIDYSPCSSRARETIVSNFTLKMMGSKYQRVFDELVR
jgi:glycosyltransferase involved in cell wall biosynthesis